MCFKMNGLVGMPNVQNLQCSQLFSCRMLEYYNANDEVEQMIRRLFR